MENVEIGGQNVGGDSKLKITVNSLIKIIGGLFLILNGLFGWAYFDLRDQLKSATEILSDEKKEFLDDIEDEYRLEFMKYDTKFDKMFDDVSDIKGDIKVILDRANRINPVQPNPNAVIQPNTNLPPTN